MKKAIGTLASFTLLGCVVCTSALAADDSLGLYTGLGLGEATPQRMFDDPYGISRYAVSGHEFGWSALVGIRPIRWVGAEVQYIDFGRTHIGPSSAPDGAFYGADGHTYAAAAYAVGYLPLPWRHPWLDLFGKAGVSPLWTSYGYSGNYTGVAVCTTPPPTGGCPLVGRVSGTITNHETDFAYGGGLQVHIGSFAVRAEYQRVDSNLGNPALLSVGFIWEP